MSPDSNDGDERQFSDIFSRVRESRPRLQGRRSQTEMMVHILDAIRSGYDGPTRIMYKSNLSWLVCQSLLRHLAERGFVKEVHEGTRRRYELTLSGTDVLSSFTRVAEAISS